MNKKIVVGLSGGVDSSVALILLKQAGWDPVGVSLRYCVWQNPANSIRENICCTQKSLQNAQDLCKQLNVPFYEVDCSQKFRQSVLDYFVDEFKAGKTPNPCIVCNKELKFKILLDFANKIGAEKVATGHYANVEKNTKTGKYNLLKGGDEIKDQSYMLCLLPQKWLERIEFPVGNFAKKQVYGMAKENNLEFTIKQRESQDFCFVSGSSLKFFLEEKIGKKQGKVKDSEGNVVGTHQGIHFHTIGQRRGLGISSDKPYYITKLDPNTNTVFVTKDETDPALFTKKITVSPYNQLVQTFPKQVEAKTRYQQPLSKANLFIKNKTTLELEFDQPVKAVSPGQFAVFYDKNVCLGGGKIV